MFLALQIEKYSFPLDLSLSPRESILLYDTMVKVRESWPRKHVRKHYWDIGGVHSNYSTKRRGREVGSWSWFLWGHFRCTIIVIFHDLFQSLDPEEFFKDKIIITKTEARQYEKQLKEELEMWIKNGFQNEVFFISHLLIGKFISLLNCCCFWLGKRSAAAA